MNQYVIEPIVQVAFVQRPPATTFSYFTSRFGDWWPRDPSLCSEVRVEFTEPTPGMSRVALTHKHFERHGADGAGYRAEMASDYGWPLLLKMFAAAAND